MLCNIYAYRSIAQMQVYIAYNIEFYEFNIRIPILLEQFYQALLKSVRVHSSTVCAVYK